MDGPCEDEEEARSGDDVEDEDMLESDSSVSVEYAAAATDDKT